MNLVRHEAGFSTTENRFPTKGTCLAIYSRCVNAELAIEEVLGMTFPWCSSWSVELKGLFSAYVEAKLAQNVLDYDDLLLHWAQMLGDPGLAEHMGNRFDHVLVDEYQDTNRLQAAIIFALKPGGRGVTVVGDDAQSIYSFRAATVRNILDFPAQFTPPAEIVTLDRNYRSTQSILAAANGVIDLAAERFTKNLWSDRNSGARPQLVDVRDEADQAGYIADRVLENRETGSLLKQQAVLFRHTVVEKTSGASVISSTDLNPMPLCPMDGGDEVSDLFASDRASWGWPWNCSFSCSETCLRSSTTASSGTSCFSRSSRPSRPENGRIWVLSGDQAGGLRKRLNQLVDEVDDFLEVSRARRGTPWRLVRAAEKIPRRAL